MPKKTTTKKPTGKLTVQLVLDRSGSMQTCKAETISAYNHYVSSLAKQAKKSVLSLMQFDSQGIDSTEFLPVGEVAPLNDETFVPRSMTPLLDAIGKGVARLDAQEGDRKVLVILTDGHENASREYSKEAIKKLLDEREAKDWLIIYLGANQDAITTGAQFGTKMASTMSFDTQNVGATMDAVFTNSMAYANAGTAAEGKLRAAFSSEQREAAVRRPVSKPRRGVRVDIKVGQ